MALVFIFPILFSQSICAVYVPAGLDLGLGNILGGVTDALGGVAGGTTSAVAGVLSGATGAVRSLSGAVGGLYCFTWQYKWFA